MPKTVQTPAILNEAIRLRREGKTLSEIAELFGVNLTTIRQWTLSVPAMPARGKGTPELVARAIGLREQGVSVEQIAKIIDVSNVTISRWTRHLQRVRCKRQPKPDDDAESIIGQASYRSDSHNFDGHAERFAGHMKRIRDYMREHSDQTTKAEWDAESD